MVIDRTHVLEAVDLIKLSLFKTSNGGRDGERERERKRLTLSVTSSPRAQGKSKPAFKALT